MLLAVILVAKELARSEKMKTVAPVKGQNFLLVVNLILRMIPPLFRCDILMISPVPACQYSIVLCYAPGLEFALEARCCRQNTLGSPLLTTRRAESEVPANGPHD